LFVFVTNIIIVNHFFVGRGNLHRMAVGSLAEVLDELVTIFMVDVDLKTGMENTLAPWKYLKVSSVPGSGKLSNVTFSLTDSNLPAWKIYHHDCGPFQ
jgi:hypothetical protein